MYTDRLFIYFTDEYVTRYNGAVTSLTHDGTEVASNDDPEDSIFSPVFAPCGLLFGVLSDVNDLEQDEIIALDAQTLQPRYRFGLSLLNNACGLAVVGEELFVCDKEHDVCNLEHDVCDKEHDVYMTAATS